MATTHPGFVLRHVRRMMAARDERSVSDQMLLDRFVRRREEAAFEALVRRHGPLVLGVCRRVLSNWHDAEDVFQGTFLVLARKAASVGERASLGSWLYRVAYHMALKVRRQKANRRKREERAAVPEAADPLAEVTGRELLAAVDEELNRLPERYRAPLISCYLEGQTRDEAARQLGCSESTLKRRLEEGKSRLHARLGRRGLALSAALLTVGIAQGRATIADTLATITVRAGVLVAAGKSAAGVIPARVADLACDTARMMTIGRFKAVGAFILGLCLLGAGARMLTQAAASGQPVESQSKPQVAGACAPKDESNRADNHKQMTVAGRVFGPDGKPAPGANVAVLVRQGILLSSWEGWTRLRNEVAGQTKTDDEGRFRLVVPRTDPQANVRFVRVLATQDGAGLAWKAVDPDAAEVSVELRLTGVQEVRGRIVGIQGEAAAGLRIHADRITRKVNKGEREDDPIIRLPTSLPLATTTDAQGNFVFRGFGPGLKLELGIRDPRYQRRDEWTIDTVDAKQCENLRLVLPPGQVVEGRIIYEDTRQPVPHAKLMIANPVIDTQADGEGRFRVSIFPAKEIGIRAYPPPDAPYVPGWKDVGFRKGVVHREVEVVLPRATLVRGKISEAGNGKPVAGAFVQHNGDWRNGDTVSSPDGSYRIGVPAGAGRLMVTHPSGEFIPQVVGSAGGSLDKPIGDPAYYHGVVELDVKAGDKVKDLDITLRRGVTIKGRLVGPGGKAVASAVMLVSRHRPRTEKVMHPVHVRDGRFEVRGCDPEQSYDLIFLEYPHAPRPLMMAESLQGLGQLWMGELVNGKDVRGASLSVSAKKAAGEALVVRLSPCATAKLRFVDGDGKPKQGFIPWLQLVVTPGPQVWKAIEEKTLAAEVVTLAGPYGDQPPGQPKTDAQGYVSYTGLIPGATYRVKTYGNDMGRNVVLRDFSVEAGRTAEMEIVVK
jgi:RNA polymerase sigma factor (sigma-70 family)